LKKSRTTEVDSVGTMRTSLIIKEAMGIIMLKEEGDKKTWKIIAH
jgi:hypothetical protein